MPDVRVILAAGGVLYRETSNGLEVALIQRPRYGDEWSLPKGKLDPGETFEEAAVREIHEETGCKSKIVGFVGAVDYFVKKRPKVVVFYRMKATDIPPFELNDEVSVLEWLPVEVALERLDHDLDKTIIQRFCEG